MEPNVMTFQAANSKQLLSDTTSSCAASPANGAQLKAQQFLKTLHNSYSDVTASTANKAAKEVRARLLNKVLAPQDPDQLLSQLPTDARALLKHLDIIQPEKSFAHSMHLSDAATERMATANASPMEVAGAVSACVSRELWELPDQRASVFQTNFTLSKLLGTYFTPPNVAWYITVCALGTPLSNALRSCDREIITAASKLRVLDPACGSGIFLAAAYEVFMCFYDAALEIDPTLVTTLGSRHEYAKNVVTGQLFGIDISQRFVNVSRNLIASISGIPGDEIHTHYQGNSLLTNDFANDKDPLSSRLNELGARRWESTTVGNPMDVVLLNPPFGRLKVLQSDYTEKSRAFKTSGNMLHQAIARRKEDIETLAKHFRQNPHYKSATGGTLDWQRLFLVRSLKWLNHGGRIGAIVPSSILNDRSASAIREYIFEKFSVDQINLLAETAGLFPGVNQPTCILTASNTEGTDRFKMTGPSRTLPQPSDPCTVVPVQVLCALSTVKYPVPNTDDSGWSVLHMMHRCRRIGDISWIKNRRGECDVSFYRQYIGKGRQRLVRGDQVDRFCLGSPIGSGSRNIIMKPEFIKALNGSQKKEDIDKWRIVGRQCAYLEKKRRMAFVLVEPGNIVANSCNYLLAEPGMSRQTALLILGVLNSLIVEWRMRLTSSNNHINNYEIDDIPFPKARYNEITRYAEELMTLGHVAECATKPTIARKRQLETKLDVAVLRGYDLERHHMVKVVSDLCPERAEEILLEFDEEGTA